jgi:hypothetical protein
LICIELGVEEVREDLFAWKMIVLERKERWMLESKRLRFEVVWL